MSIITTFENQCRALTSATSPDENASRFIVGTLSPSADDNLLYLFEYKDDNNNLAKVSFKFPFGESWHLSTSSRYLNLFSAVTSSRGQLAVSLFKLPSELDGPIEDDYGLSESSVEKVCDFVRTDGKRNLCKQSHWHPDDGCQLLTCSDGRLEFWDVNGERKAREFSLLETIAKSSSRELTQTDGPVKTQKPPIITDLRWSSLFNCSVVAAAVGPKIYGIDTRIPDSSISSICWLIEDERCNRIRSMDFNPNSQYYIASGGDDCRANFWDLRKITSPVLHMKAHTHWLWSIRYNPFHDQLVLSAGSDARVALMRVQSVASEPYGHMGDLDEDDDDEDVDDDDDDDDDDPDADDQDKGSEGSSNNANGSDEESDGATKLDRAADKTANGGKRAIGADVPESEGSTAITQQQQLGDEVVKLYEEHDDSVYAVEWATDPWIFASLGFESRLVLNKVPKSEKFNILF